MLNNYDKQVVFAYSTQGANHIKKEKELEDGIFRKHPCQDRSFYGDFGASKADEIKDISLYVKNSDSKETWIKLPVNLKKHSISFKCLCVCDGHGSPAYFRSGRGAELAIQSYVELLSERIEILVECYKNNFFSKIETGLSVGIARDRWTKKIVENLIKNPISQEELEILKINDVESATLYKEDNDKFRLIEGIDEKVNFMYSSPLRRIYGCTFIAYVQVEDFWYAMQVGDGDFAISYDGISFCKPIKEDPECFGNSTTSLCGEESYNDFRFSHGKDMPKYVFCSSDGISNSVRGDEGLFDFYKWVVNRFTNIEFDRDKGVDDAKIEKARAFIADDMPKQSERGSGDDFSLAAILNFNASDFVSYEKYSELLEAFKKDLEKNLFDDSKKNQIVSCLSKVGAYGKTKIKEFYVYLSSYVARKLNEGILEEELYNEVLQHLDPKSEVYLKLKERYFEHVLSELGKNEYYPKKFDEMILFCKENKKDSLMSRFYKALFKHVKWVEENESKILESACKKIYEYLSERKEPLTDIYNFFSDVLVKYDIDLIDLCNCYKYFQENDYEKFGKVNFDLYNIWRDKDKKKSDKYLCISAVICGYVDASRDYAFDQYHKAVEFEKDGNFDEAERYYLVAVKYFRRANPKRNEILSILRKVSNFFKKIHQEKEINMLLSMFK